MPQFYVLVTVDADSKDHIISLYSPDFSEWTDNLLKINDEKYKDLSNYRDFVNAVLKDLVQTYNLDSSLQKPKNISNQPIMSAFQRWEEFDIDFPKQGKIFAQVLPSVGHFTTLTSTLCGCVITFMALKIASYNKDSDNSSLSTTLSILGTLLSALIGIVVYVYSPASETLSFLGEYLDKKCNRYNNKTPLFISLNQVDNNPKNNRYYQLSLVLALTCIIANVFIAGVSMYQESILVVEKFLTLDKTSSDAERETKLDLYRILVYVLVGTAAYRSLAFQGGFAFKLIERLRRKPEVPNNTSDDLLLDEGASEQTPLLYNFYRNREQVGQSSDLNNISTSQNHFAFRV